MFLQKILNAPSITWLIIGFAGQGLFFLRFLIQWLQSERLGKSVIPIAFWYCSIGGSIITLLYAIYIQDPVFIFGQFPGLFVYSRNLFLIRREKRLKAATAEIRG
jgi:lipid-A-disaccharide synthase-like uncharacterized protein